MGPLSRRAAVSLMGGRVGAGEGTIDRPTAVGCQGAQPARKWRNAHRTRLPRETRACRDRPFGRFPHVCGGACRMQDRPKLSLGRSPRVRGSHADTRGRDGRPGSIPACAGEPAALGARRLGIRVDPRVCGGAPREVGIATSCWGRSPRVRGSLRETPQPSSARGSIPACAGEPSHPALRSTNATVDPRVCGGAV
jgi:hypothetical protein